MKKIISYLALFSLTLAMSVTGHVLYLYTHREFGPADFRHPFISGLPGASPDEQLKKEASAALQQKFTYLNHGGQMTVYESADQRYVIKFFNPRSVIKENWFRKMPKLRRFNSLKWITNTYFRKKERLLKYITRYQMAFDDLREETGLVYAHLNQATRLSQKLHLVDKEGRSHQLELDNYPFVLQKKVELTFTHFNNLLKMGEIEQAQQGVRQIYDLFLSRTQKGYTDRLQTLDKNYGFVDGHAIQLDVGRIERKESVQQMPVKEMERIVANISPSLAGYSELAPVLNDCLEKSRRQD